MLKVNNLSSVYFHIYDFSTKKANKLKKVNFKPNTFVKLLSYKQLSNQLFQHSISSMKTN